MFVKQHVAAEFKADVDKGIIEGYGHMFRVPPEHDSDGDAVVRGAFDKTIAEHFNGDNRVRILWQHNVAEPMGKPVVLEEDFKGLYFKAQITPTAANRDRLALIRDGVVDTMSIGFDVGRVSHDENHLVESGWRKGEPIRIIEEVSRLWEISPVTFAADENARVAAKRRGWVAMASGVLVPTDQAMKMLADDEPAEPDAEAPIELVSEPMADDGESTPDEALDDLLNAIDHATGLAEELGGEDVADEIEKAVKRGRVLSSRNEKDLRSAIDTIGAAVDTIEQVLERAKPAEEEEGKAASLDNPVAGAVDANATNPADDWKALADLMESF